MEGLKSYLFTVVAVCFLTTLVKSAAGRAKTGRALELACGLLVILTVIRPLLRLETKDLSTAIGKILSQTEDAEQMSRSYHARITADVIKEKTETYIWDKADEEGFSPTLVSAEVSFGSAYPYVSAVTIAGPYTDLQKKRVGEWIETALAIPEDRQRWHWNKS